jgi:MinD-like ATPase involved in chromosome partitioning or flagellar assembly
MYFARVTKNPKKDLKRGTSLHFSDEKEGNRKLDGNEIVVDGYICTVLKGLCGYEMEAETIEEAIEELEELKNSSYIPFDNTFEWHIFEGEEISEYLPDGNLFYPINILK